MTKKFILERSMLKKGDVILTASNTKNSIGIRVATWSRYSHAALWVGGTMIEAVPEGVFSKNAQRVLSDQAEHLAVYRSKVPLTAEMEKKACEYAQSKVGSLYAKPEAALMLPMRSFNIKESEKQFCSRLVACSLEHAGLDLQNLRNPSFCSPRQLSLCKAFEKVDDIVREATSSEIEFAETADPGTKNFSDMYQWLNEVRSLVNGDQALAEKFDIQAANDVTALLLRHPELDERITSYVKKTDYLTFYDYDRAANSYRYDKADMLKKLSQYLADSGDFLEDELSKESDLVARYDQNIVAVIHHIGIRRLEYFIEILGLYRNIMNEVKTRVDVIAWGFEFIGEAATSLQVRELSNLIRDVILKADKVIKG